MALFKGLIQNMGISLNETETDFALLRRMRAGDMAAEEELCLRYAKQVRACARPFSLMGWDHEDFIQEGMLGLLRAAHSYQEACGTPFSAYVALCVRRQLLNAVRRARNSKNILLTDFVSYDAPAPGGDGSVSLRDTLPDEQSSFEEEILREDWLNRMLDALSARLSALEARVLRSYLSGASVSEIAEALSLPEKTVDNAVTRIRRKAAELTKGDFRS